MHQLESIQRCHSVVGPDMLKRIHLYEKNSLDMTSAKIRIRFGGDGDEKYGGSVAVFQGLWTRSPRVFVSSDFVLADISVRSP